MRNTFGGGLLIGALVVGGLFAPSLLAGQAPAVYTVAEARDPAGTGPVIILTGKGLSRFRTFALLTGTGDPSGLALTVLKQSGSSLCLSVMGDPAAGTYLLTAAEKGGAEQSYTVSLSNGKVLPGSVDGGALSASLRSDLDDAATLGGNAPAYFTDAGNLSFGTLDPARFSAYADLSAEGKIGTGAGKVAAGDHAHAEYLTNASAASIYAPIAHDHDSVYAKKGLIGAKVFLSSDFSTTSGVEAKVPFGAEDFDTDNCHSNTTNPTRLTCNSAGYYAIVARGHLQTWGYTDALLKKNGSEVIATGSRFDGTYGWVLYSQTIDHLDVGDYVEFSILNTGGNGTLQAAKGRTELMMVRIGE